MTTCFSLKGTTETLTTASVSGRVSSLRFRASNKILASVSCKLYLLGFRASNIEYLLRPIGQATIYKGKEEEQKKINVRIVANGHSATGGRRYGIYLSIDSVASFIAR